MSEPWQQVLWKVNWLNEAASVDQYRFAIKKVEQV